MNLSFYNIYTREKTRKTSQHKSARLPATQLILHG